MPIKEPSRDSYEALRFLFKFLADHMGTTQKELAPQLGVNRNTLSKLKSADKFRDIAENILKSRENARTSLPRFMRSTLEEIYTADTVEQLIGLADKSNSPYPSRGIIRDPIVFERPSRYPDHDNDARVRREGFLSLAGLSVLVRPSNEPLKIKANEYKERVSLSIVNIIPDYIECGPQPLFKIRQRGARGNTTIDIEGLILAQDDRIILSGREMLSRRHVLASIFYNPEDAARYRSTETDTARTGMSGVMLGASNSRAHFSSLFRLYAIPHTFIAEDDLGNERLEEGFKKRYSEARELAGVYAEDEIESTLKSLGITDCMKDIGEMLRQADAERIFSVA